ncbi:hypothetical protein FHY16_002606 [Xanthomonas campestris]|nr:hypothetical protein [Xanthomonas euroxanthea]
MDKIRPYQPWDFDACMALFDANVPAFFSAGERVDFAGFLIQHATAWHYQLLERGNEIAGGAGYAINADGITASLCWGMSIRACTAAAWARSYCWPDSTHCARCRTFGAWYWIRVNIPSSSMPASASSCIR